MSDDEPLDYVTASVRKESSWSVTGWLKRNVWLLLIFAATVLYQTKLFGYYSPEAVRERVKEEAQRRFQFGTWTRRVLRSADGPLVQPGQWVTADMQVWNENHEQVWSTKMEGRPFGFAVGQRKVLKGLDAAVQEMAVGEKARLVLAPDMAFGERGKRTWRIDPWQTVSLDIEVLSAGEKPPEEAKQEQPASREERPPADDEETLEPITDAVRDAYKVERKQAPPRQEPQAELRAESKQEEGTQIASDLATELRKLSLERFQEPLAAVGMITVDDLMMIDSPMDLPESLPMFSRKKLAAHARKLAAAAGGPGAGGGGKMAVSADGTTEECAAGEQGCAGGKATS
eukprot:TRINITY_DN25703_c0_g1_i1.p1 TRINITY_DN25703_c0_g1~~TRINITY_DN25703_c0_g1_i1.p1  ORF type:complete len:381 (+),score=120.68 TRINITY_DN25703_c0_g1_i1:113-1144(+)